MGIEDILNWLRSLENGMDRATGIGNHNPAGGYPTTQDQDGYSRLRDYQHPPRQGGQKSDSSTLTPYDYLEGTKPDLLNMWKRENRLNQKPSTSDELRRILMQSEMERLRGLYNNKRNL